MSDLPASSPVVRTDRMSGPMSFGQQRLWFQHELEPDAPHHALGRAYVIRGPLDLGALERALGEVVRRHEPLRTTFHVEDGRPVQRIQAEVRVPIARIELSGATDAERQRLVDGRVLDELRRPFDPARGPVLRAAVARLAAGHYALILTQRFIGADRWSRAVLHRELSSLYTAFLRREPSSLPPVPLRYVDFAAWQRERLQGGRLDRLLQYWTGQLAEAPDGPALIPDRTAPVRTRSGDTVFARLPSSLADRVSALGVGCRVTPFMLYLAAFDVLLHRLTGDTDIVVSAPVAGRLRPDVEPLIGFFGNTLAMRADLSGDPSFLDVLAGVRRTTLDAFRHQELPFERVVEALASERPPHVDPLGRVLFAYQNQPDIPLRLAGCEVDEHEAVSVTFGFELGLSLYPSAAGVLVRAQYQTDRFVRTTVERVLARYERLLDGIVADPSQPISHLPLMSADERRRVIGWRATRDVDAGALVHRRFEAQVDRTPDVPALTCRGESVCYAELDARANRFAHRLVSAGVRPGHVVGLALARSVDLVVALVAVLKAGAAYLPLDARDPTVRQRRILADAGASVVIVDGTMTGAADLDLRAIDLRAPPVLAGQKTEGRLAIDGSPEDLAYVMFTSGSTGAPKGVEIPHRAVLRLVAAEIVSIGPGDAMLQAAPVSFDASTFEVWAALLSGARLVVFPDAALDLDDLARLLHRERISHAWLTASLFNALVDLYPSALEKVRCLLTGGETLSVPHVRAALARQPDLRLFNGYGPTEATTFTLVHAIDAPVASDVPSIPIGRPIAGTTVFVLDAHRAPVPVGVPGELYVGGAGLAHGYRASPALTAERFVDVSIDGVGMERLYRTGDRVRYRPDGAVEFLGRVDRQVKLRGFRIELDEVEAQLASHPAVSSAAVVMREDEPDHRRLVAYVVPVCAIEPADVVAHMQARVPSYMVPSTIVVLDRLPLTPSGKVDRHALPPAAGRGTRPDHRPVAGETPEALIVARIWAETLGMSSVDPDANFFEIGGHSLLATQVITRLRTHLHVDLPLRAIFEHPTAAGLSSYVSGLQRRAATASERPASRRGPASAPLSFAQSRLWFLHELDPDGAAYNSPRSYHLAGPLDVPALRRACEAIVRRHAALRSVFVVDGEEPRQVVRDDASVPFDVLELADRPLEERTALFMDGVRGAVARPFDLARDTLMRVLLVRLAPDEHVLVITLHHIATDGWSMGLIGRELGAYYRAFRDGTPPALPPLPLQYADYAEWLRGHLAGPRLDALLDYWRRQLRGLTPFEIPANRPRQHGGRPPAARRVLRIDPALAHAIGAFGRGEGATTFMVLLAAFMVVLARAARRSDVAVATPVANRLRPELEAIVGFFVNTLVLRADLSGDTTGRHVLARVRRMTLEAFEHQECPFEKIVEELRPERRAGHLPLTSVLFALQNAPDEGVSLAGLSVVRRTPVSERVRFDLELTMRPDGSGGLGGGIVYRADLFDARTVDALAEAFVAEVRTLIASPDAPVCAGASPAAAISRAAPAASGENGRRPPHGDAPGSSDRRLSPTQARLVRIWRTLLQVDDVGLDDEFFDLGGHSLLAARLMVRLEAEVEQRLPISVLFEHGTIRQLASVIDGAASAPWTPLVPLRRRGTRKPLFLVHALGGEVVGFRELAGHLPDDQPVYAIQGQGPGAGADLPVAIEPLAARYIDLMRAVDPEGPYLVGGYSAGGILALEIARQLEAAGQKIALVVVLDSGLPAHARQAYRLRAHTPLSLSRQFWFWVVDDALQMRWRDWPERLRSKARAIAARTVRRGGTPVDIRDRLGIYRYPKEYSAYLTRRFSAFQQFRPRPVDGPILFVRSRTGSLHGPPAEALVADWRRLAAGAFETASVACSHTALLREPHVRRVAAHLEAALRRVPPGEVRRADRADTLRGE